uniref:AMP-dependent synthetase/ligase domain-containing protein n=1 Tax=Panagrolaimus sp. JU765 TaxID=591449 RepID=A0AC34RHQ7_9BILA
MIGGVFTAISSHFTNYEISHQLRNSESVVVFVDGSYLKKVLAVLPECPKIRKIVVLGNFPKTNSPVEIVPFKHLNKFSTERPTNVPEINPEDIFWLPYSSGTTGLPKGVMITHKNWLDHFKSYINHANNVFKKNMDLPDSPYLIAFMPIYHAMGYSGSLTALIRGQTIVLMKKYKLENLLQLIEKYRPNFLAAAPVIAQQMAKNPIAQNYDVSSIKWIGTGGAKLDEGCMKTLYEKFPNIEVIGQGYGMTECVTVLTMTRAKRSDPMDSSGYPFYGVEIKIVDPETEIHVPIGKLGEIRFKAPYTMKGYWKNPEATR